MDTLLNVCSYINSNLIVSRSKMALKRKEAGFPIMGVINLFIFKILSDTRTHKSGG